MLVLFQIQFLDAPLVDVFLDHTPGPIVFVFDDDVLVEDDHFAVFADHGLAGIKRDAFGAAADDANALVVEGEEYIVFKFEMATRLPFLIADDTFAWHAVHADLFRYVLHVLLDIAGLDTAGHAHEP